MIHFNIHSSTRIAKTGIGVYNLKENLCFHIHCYKLMKRTVVKIVIHVAVYEERRMLRFRLYQQLAALVALLPGIGTALKQS